MKTPAAALIVLALLSGCTLPTFYLDPAIPVRGTVAQMNVTDARAPMDFPRANPKPDPSRAVGIFGGLPLALNEDAAIIVASLVALKDPGATVVLREFSNTTVQGLWVATMTVRVSAEITSTSGKVVTVGGMGQNTFANSTRQNFELAYERALADFAANLGTVQL